VVPLEYYRRRTDACARAAASALAAQEARHFEDRDLAKSVIGFEDLGIGDFVCSGSRG